jgi:hypothetical protein
MEPAGQPDPFEHFGEQELSWSAIETYRNQVIALARKVFEACPDEPIGALILCPGAPLGRLLAQSTPAQRRPDPDRQTCVTGMPRPDFDKFVQLNAPAVLDQLPEPDPAWRRTLRTLPVLIATTNGHRLACFHYDIV